MSKKIKMNMASLLEATRGEYEGGREGRYHSKEQLASVKRALSNPVVHEAAKILGDLPFNVLKIITNPDLVEKKYGVSLDSLVHAVKSQEEDRAIHATSPDDFVDRMRRSEDSQSNKKRAVAYDSWKWPEEQKFDIEED